MKLLRHALLVPLVSALCGFAGLSRAATVDLTTLTSLTGVNSAATVSGNAATLYGTSSLSGSVADLSSFEWWFTAGDIFIAPEFGNDYAFIQLGNTSLTLADIALVGDFGTTGWRTYTFATPYSGSFAIGVANQFDDNLSSSLEIRNFTLADTATVPEPATYGMLLGGLLLVGGFGWRGGRRRGTLPRGFATP